MPSFTGKYRFKSSPEVVEQSGSCRVIIDGQILQLVPENRPPVAVDLGDIDAYVPGEYELTLDVYDGSVFVLSHFGKTYQNLTQAFVSAWRDRTIQCLLLEDLEEVVRVEGAVQLETSSRKFSSRAELRLFRSNLAALPENASGFQWRLADIDSVDFDENSHALNLASLDDRLVLGKLAKRTVEFERFLKSSMSEVAENAADVIRRLFPFLGPAQFQKLAEFWKEGRSSPLAEMERIDPRIRQALLEQTVSAGIRPYFEALRKCALESEMYAGFKRIRKEAEEDTAVHDAAVLLENAAAEEPEMEAEEAGPSEEAQSVLHWFFLPIRASGGAPQNVVAWEVVSRGGRATYFFRMVPEDKKNLLQDSSSRQSVIRDSIRGLNQALVLLNFRREPIYLRDELLEMQSRYRRYAIACRKIPVLRALRGAFLGRAIHTSPQDWEDQVQKILAKAALQASR